MYFEASGDISNIKWHPIVSYFIPVSDEVLEPYAVFDDIHIYIQEFVHDSEDIKRTLKPLDISTGYSIYPSQLAYYLGSFPKSVEKQKRIWYNVLGDENENV